jgi:hypothetical protein
MLSDKNLAGRPVNYKLGWLCRDGRIVRYSMLIFSASNRAKGYGICLIGNISAAGSIMKR